MYCSACTAKHDASCAYCVSDTRPSRSPPVPPAATLYCTALAVTIFQLPGCLMSGEEWKPQPTNSQGSRQSNMHAEQQAYRPPAGVPWVPEACSLMRRRLAAGPSAAAASAAAVDAVTANCCSSQSRNGMLRGPAPGWVNAPDCMGNASKTGSRVQQQPSRTQQEVSLL